MAANINAVGWLAEEGGMPDVDVHTTRNNSLIAQFRFVVRDKTPYGEELTTFDCVAFGKVAESVKTLKLDDFLELRGEMRQRTGENGDKRYEIKIYNISIKETSRPRAYTGNRRREADAEYARKHGL